MYFVEQGVHPWDTKKLVINALCRISCCHNIIFILGFKLRWALDNDAAAANTYRHNFPNTHFICEDVTNFVHRYVLLPYCAFCLIPTIELQKTTIKREIQEREKFT